METKQTGSGDKFLDVAAYVLALILFLKTADVMGYFAPDWINQIFGFDVGFLYGIVNASLVEGAALALHFNHRAKLSKSAQIVKWILVGISAVCQVLDGYISTGNVANMTDTLKLTLQVGVPLIPIAVFIMLILIGQLPEGGQSKPFKGIKNMLPNPRRLWNGDGYVAPVTPVVNASTMSLPTLKKQNRAVNDDDIALAKSINPLAAPYRACPNCDDIVPLAESVCGACGQVMPSVNPTQGQGNQK